MTDSLIDIKGMSPRQVVAALKDMRAGFGNYKDTWEPMAVNVVKHIGWIAVVLEADDEVRDGFIKNEGCSPYSLLGIQKLAADDAMAEQAIRVVKDLANIHDDEADPVMAKLLRKAVLSGIWLHTKFLPYMPEDMKLRWKIALEDLFSGIEDDHELVERFCAGAKTTLTTEPALLS